MNFFPEVIDVFVKSVMIPKSSVYTLQFNEPLKAALEKLEAHRIDGLPVLNHDQYEGILTRYRIYEVFFVSGMEKEDYLSNIRAADICTHKDVFLRGDEIFEKTLLMLKDFPLLAVVNGKRTFQGVVTRYDVLEQFQSAFGMKKRGVSIAFTSVEVEGRIARLSEIAKQFHEHIISLVTFDETDKLVRRIVMKVEKKDNIDKFIKNLEDSGFRILYIQEDE
jgi:CBS-domain-containing membrane protein